MTCKKKSLLLEHYADKAHLFSRAVERMLRYGQNSGFKVSRQAADLARKKCDLARLSFGIHIRKHGC